MRITEQDVLKAYECSRLFVANSNQTFGFPLGKQAFAYIRCSSPQQLKGSSLSRQIEGIHSAAYKRGCCIPFSNIFAECCSATGPYTNQQKLMDLLNTINNTQQVSIFCEDNDRLSRHEGVVEILENLRTLKSTITFTTLPTDYWFFKKYFSDVIQYEFETYGQQKEYYNRLFREEENKRREAHQKDQKVSRI